MGFDDEQIKLLRPLAEARAVLHFPFFANTFPLGYHYFQSLEMDTQLVMLHDWATPIPIDLESELHQPHVFYTTEVTKEVLENAAQKRQLITKSAFFTEYNPRMFFFDFSVALNRLIDRYAKERKMTTALGTELRKLFAVVEIFTDIPEQASLVTKLLHDAGLNAPIDVKVVKSWEDVFSLSPKDISRLTAYFYGAPVSSDLESKPHKYIGILLPEASAEDPKFKTFISVVSPRVKDQTSYEVKIDEIVGILEEYHKRLFDAANNRQKDLRSVSTVYNRYAQLLRHNSGFEDEASKAFARCLISYHKDTDSSKDIISSSMDLINSVYSPPQIQQTDLNPGHLHIHFGAGKLAIGLVLPLLTQAARLIILQRQSNEWKPLRTAKSVRISNSRGFSRETRVIYDKGDLSPERISSYFDSWDGQPILICASENNLTKFRNIIENADSISCSLGEGQPLLATTLQELSFSKRVNLYPFENVTNLAALRNENINVVRLISDRICSDRKFPSGAIHVKAEESGEVVMYGDNGEGPKLFVAPNINVNLIFAPTNEIYDFYHNRKRYLMNSVHMVLAIYGYYYLAEQGISLREWERQYVSILQDTILSEEKVYSHHITNFISAQIQRLIINLRPDVRKYVFDGKDIEDIYEDLQKYSKNVLDRIGSTTDILERVFDLKNADKATSKYNEFISDVVEFVETKKGDMDQLPIYGKRQSHDILETLRDINRKVFVAFAISSGSQPEQIRSKKGRTPK